jgi:hypothetical protein
MIRRTDQQPTSPGSVISTGEAIKVPLKPSESCGGWAGEMPKGGLLQEEGQGHTLRGTWSGIGVSMILLRMSSSEKRGTWSHMTSGRSVQ